MRCQLCGPPARIAVTSMGRGFLVGATAGRRTPERRRSAAKHVQLFGGGCIMLQVQRAAEILKERYGVTSDIWGATSYQLEQGVNPDKLYSAEV